MNYDEWALNIATCTAERSTCARAKRGAVAIDKYRRIIGIGYNGVPRGFPHCTEVPCPGANDPPGDTDNCMAIHAEINAIINSSSPYEIETMYVTAFPCFKCALVLANLPNLRRVVYLEEYADMRGHNILLQAGVHLQHYPSQKADEERGKQWQINPTSWKL